MADLVTYPLWVGDQGHIDQLDDELYERISLARRRALDEQGVYITFVSAFRTREEQVQLRRQNCGTSDYAIYHMPSGLCHPATAIPGTSMHERGLAADLSPGPRSIPAVALIFHQLGLVGPVLSESWHYELDPNRPPIPDQPTPPEVPVPIAQNDSLIRHRDGRVVLVNGVTRLGSVIPNPDAGNWIKGFYAFCGVPLEDHTVDSDTGTALIDFRVVNIVATQ